MAKKSSSKSSKPVTTITLGDEEDEIQESVRTKVQEFTKSIDALKIALKPLTESLATLESNSDAVDKARLDLTAVYALNSLFWLYLLTQGKNPKDHEVKSELDRLKVSMGRLRDIETSDVNQRKPVDSTVAKRVIKHTLSLTTRGDDTMGEGTSNKRFKK